MEILKVKMSEIIKQEILVIDAKHYIDSIVPISWYDRYDKNTEVILLKTYCDLTVGYLIIAGIKKELYDSFKNGVLVGDVCINPNMFDGKSNYRYLPSIVIIEEYRSMLFGGLMLDLALKYYYKNVIAISTSKGGYALLNKRFNHIMKLTEKVELFEL